MRMVVIVQLIDILCLLHILHLHILFYFYFHWPPRYRYMEECNPHNNQKYFTFFQRRDQTLSAIYIFVRNFIRDISLRSHNFRFFTSPLAIVLNNFKNASGSLFE
jgi:hypothetical protein